MMRSHQGGGGSGLDEKVVPRTSVFDVGARDIPGATFVWCRGELDIASEERVVTEVARALGHPVTSLVLDLRGLTFADCTVIRCIQYAAAACERCQMSLYVDVGDCVRELVKTLDPESLGTAKKYL